MDDLGAPSSYLVLEDGAKVYSSDGEEVGRVAEVRADGGADIFDGLVIARGALPTPGSRHFVAAEAVEEVYERGVVLKLDSEEVGSLPEPS